MDKKRSVQKIHIYFSVHLNATNWFDSFIWYHKSFYRSSLAEFGILDIFTVF